LFATIDLHKFASLFGFRNRGGVHAQQCRRELLEHLQFVIANVVTLVLRKPEHEKPPITKVSRKNGSITPAFALASPRDALLDDTPAKLSIDQALEHFRNRLA